MPGRAAKEVLQFTPRSGAPVKLLNVKGGLLFPRPVLLRDITFYHHGARQPEGHPASCVHRVR